MKKYMYIKSGSDVDNRFPDHIFMERAGQRFSVYYGGADDPATFRVCISEIHPYDDGDYAWARRYAQDGNTGKIIRNGKVIKTVQLPNYDPNDYEDATEYTNEVVDTLMIELRKCNRDVEPRIVHN